MNDAAHTPTPWHVHYLDDCDNPPILLDSNNELVPASGRNNAVAKANIAFTINAVNCHALLISALRIARDYIKDDDAADNYDGAAWEARQQKCLSEIDDILIKAGEP
jgi:hypothetical protein